MPRDSGIQTAPGVARMAALLLALGLSLLLPAGEAQAQARGPLIGPYFGAPFAVTRLAHRFDQAPSWTRDGQVLSGEPDAAGTSQIYRARADGSRQVCLTCRTVAGQNAFPQERPQGDWILFASYGQQAVHTGRPGFGGYGGDLYAMRTDGSRARRLTTASDPGGGARYTATSGVPYDNFHAF